MIRKHFRRNSITDNQKGRVSRQIVLLFVHISGRSNKHIRCSVFKCTILNMNLPKFPHSAMFIGVTACGKTEFLLRLLETIYKSHFEFIVILCPTILDNKTYLSRKWIFDDNNVFVVCDIEGKLNEWIKLFKNSLKGHQTLFIIDDCSA